ncbi:hypothetical protein ACIGXA_21875 [Streptomyces fildesensis]|uniref:Uncharacterized protein n=1 Tax=Streptomyces fildesensis TaxID=375757 RepID=A0ABW8CCQ9_9ACTN
MIRAAGVLSGQVRAFFVQLFGAGTLAGVFVALDDGPDHPVFPGVGFITIPELSWRHSPQATGRAGQLAVQPSWVAHWWVNRAERRTAGVVV